MQCHRKCQKNCTCVYYSWLVEIICRLARSNRRNKFSSPYSAQELKFTDFMNLRSLAGTIMKNWSVNVSWLKIKLIRYKMSNLLKLCNTEAIPKEFHYWYKNIPSSKKKNDTNIITGSEDKSRLWKTYNKM